MPLEHTQLRGEAEKFEACPSCGSAPFKSMLRGSVQRSFWNAPFAWLSAKLRKEPWEYCSIICDACKDIVGHEAPPLSLGTNVWCPGCDLNLCRHGHLFSDNTGEPVIYDCSRCGRRSFWEFGAPVPFRIPDPFLNKRDP